MKKLVFITFFLGLVSFGQTIEKFSIDSGGDSFSDNSLSVLYTIGEVVVQEVSVGNTTISEGFINPIISGPLSVKSVIENNLIVFPNPADHFITIKSDYLIDKIELYNALGSHITTINNTLTFNVNNFDSGMYFLKIHSENKVITKKILIK